MAATNVLRIDGVYYDTAKLAAIHPGGELFVLISNNRDGTTLFNSSHRRAFPHDKYKAYQVAASKVDAAKFPEAPPTQDFSLYWEICEKVKPHVPRGGFAPWYYYIKVGVLVAAYLALEVYFLMYGRTLGLTVAAGIVSAFIGLNIQHDANHGAVSRNPLVNRLLGFTQDCIGGSGLNWMVSHDTIHHVHCNDIGRDHDLDIPLLRMHKRVPWQVTYTLQQVYVWVLEAFFGVAHVMQSGIRTILGPNQDQEIFKSYWNTHRLLLALNLLRLGANFYLFPTWNTVQMVLAYYMVGGLYLAFFFIISHNFDGAKKEGVDTNSGCFVRNQAETSSNVGGWLLAQMNGGLNYQIEHHLFPRMHHSNYHYIAPIVRSICEKHGIQYVHFPTIWDNVASMFEHMRALGSKPM